MNKDRKVSIRITEEQYRYLSDKGKLSSVLSDIIDREMSDNLVLSDKLSDKNVDTKTRDLRAALEEYKLQKIAKEKQPAEKILTPTYGSVVGIQTDQWGNNYRLTTSGKRIELG